MTITIDHNCNKAISYGGVKLPPAASDFMKEVPSATRHVFDKDVYKMSRILGLRGFDFASTDNPGYVHTRTFTNQLVKVRFLYYSRERIIWAQLTTWTPDGKIE